MPSRRRMRARKRGLLTYRIFNDADVSVTGKGRYLGTLLVHEQLNDPRMNAKDILLQSSFDRTATWDFQKLNQEDNIMMTTKKASINGFH